MNYFPALLYSYSSFRASSLKRLIWYGFESLLIFIYGDWLCSDHLPNVVLIIYQIDEEIFYFNFLMIILHLVVIRVVALLGLINLANSSYSFKSFVKKLHSFVCNCCKMRRLGYIAINNGETVSVTNTNDERTSLLTL